MILGVVKRILKDDLARSGDLPGWMDGFLQPLNDFIEKVGLALQNRLTFADNFSCKLVTQTFTSGVESQINPQKSASGPHVKPSGVFLLDPNGAVVSSFGWSRKPNGNIGITVGFLSAQSSSCTILILLG